MTTLNALVQNVRHNRVTNILVLHNARYRLSCCFEKHFSGLNGVLGVSVLPIVLVMLV